MNDETDAELLRRYAAEKSEDAFAALVHRRIGLVYSVALRQCGGDAHLAEDVTQRVFGDLARKAGALASRAVLSGWLHRSAQFAASDVVRAERRRRAREEESHTMQPATTEPPAADWERLRPLLDEAMAELDDEDRDAVALRFFENRAFADIGATLRLSDDAARKRVERALGKLHASLGRRGVTSTTGALALALANQAGVAAPAGIAASVTSAALAGAASGGGLGAAKIIIASAALIGAAAVGVAVNRAWVARAARAELAATARQADELRAKVQAAAGRLASSEQRAKAADEDQARLLQAMRAAAEAGRLPAGSGSRMAFVIDTSGSMRSPKTGKLWPIVATAIGEALAARPEVGFVQLLDADGRAMFEVGDGWRSRAAAGPQELERVLGTYNRETISNPVPGIVRALRGMPAPEETDAELHVVVIGDELNSMDNPEAILRQLDKLSPADAKGARRATISAIQLPTTVQHAGKMGNTGVKFQALMTEVAKQHGGAHRLLPTDALQ